MLNRWSGAGAFLRDVDFAVELVLLGEDRLEVIGRLQ